MPLLQSPGAKPPRDLLRVGCKHPACRACLRAGFLYIGATLMAFDAVSSAVGPHFFPHLFFACEGAISCGGKVGAAVALLPELLFGGLIRAVVAAVLGYETVEGGGR